MFSWWNEPILPNSQVRWNYPVVFSVIWLVGKYSFSKTFDVRTAAIDVLMILFACIFLASMQAIFLKPEKQPETETQEKGPEKQAKQRKRKAKR